MRNNAILLCGGCGSRMAPIKNCNKSLLRIRGEINLLRILRILENKGIFDVTIATNPFNLEGIHKVLENSSLEFPELVIRIVSAEDYYKGCNNIVTLRAVAEYIGNTYIMETDQYYVEENLEFLQSEPLEESYFFTQKREEEDWGVVSEDDSRILKVLHQNPEKKYYCLSGISYFTGDASKYLKCSLKNIASTDIYWEELMESYQGPIYEWKSPEDYSIEFDNITDLINKKLAEPQYIANLIDDNGKAERLNSMTNTTFKVTVDGNLYALRIPGYGTDNFVNHSREQFMESSVPFNLRPRSFYYSNNSVKLTEYLEGYKHFDDLSEMISVLKALHEIHEDYIPMTRSNYIDLAKEIADYEKVYVGHIEPPEDYENMKSFIFSYLKEWFTNHSYEKVHRDLVPSNIMVNKTKSKDKDVKFIDWEYSGTLSRYWDLASLCVEYADEHPMVDLDFLVDFVTMHYPGDISKVDLYRWIAVVDFVWAVWSLAKYTLGDSVKSYGDKRYNRALGIVNEYFKEESLNETGL